jgi:serine/threonine protein kinase
MVHDYLGDRYYTDEERVEIRRELLKEMDERKDELEAAVEKSSKIRFKKGEVLGAGSFGQVFLGLNEATGELLAVKEVDCSRAGEAAITSLEAEIEMLQLLRHPNIVAYYGVQRHAGVAVLVEYCAGGSIASVISNFGALNEQVVRSYTRQILQGLDYLHKHCIVHRDVKCANVLLDSDGNVKVADFGASKNLSQINGEGHQMSMKGTPFFMAPEVVLQQVAHLSLYFSLSLSLSVCVRVYIHA